MKYAKNLTVSLVGALLLTACVKDTIYNTDHPAKARVTVSTDWTSRGAGVPKPAAYTITSNGFSERATTDRHTMESLLGPGSHNFTLYNEPAGISVSAGIASVDKVAGAVEPLPGWLFTGTTTAILEKDSEPTITVAMRQQVRQLTLVLRPDGGDADAVTAITATLSGVAASWETGTDLPSGEAAKVNMAFARQSDGSWSATVRLLGITGPEQRLSGTVTVSGLSTPVALDADLSAELSAFNDDKKTPLGLGGTVELPIEAGFTATINNWSVISGSGTAD